MRDGSLSPADIAVLSGNTGNGNNCNNGWGENGAWWIILFLIFGWGRGGYGNYGFGGGSGVADNYVLATDFATLERKLDSISNGICDSTFALNNTMTNGFAATQQTLCQGFSGINQAISTNGYETRLGINNLNAELASCCCQTQRGIDGINYNMAMNTNNIQQTLCNNTRDIIDNQNANYRALHDEIVANRIEDKNAQIAAQQNEINALRLKASQEAQNTYLINQLKPCPSAAYIVPNPNCCYNYSVNGFGYNNGCNCGNY